MVTMCIMRGQVFCFTTFVKLVFLVLVTRGVRAARRVDANVHLQNALYKRQLQMADMTSEVSPRHRRATVPLPMPELDEVMSLGPNSALEVTRSATTVQGTKLLRLQETFKGIPVDDAVLTVETDSTGQHVQDASGAVYQDIEEDTDGTANIDPQTAADICIKFNSHDTYRDNIHNVTSVSKIFLSAENRAYTGYLVQYLLVVYCEEYRPACVINARDGKINDIMETEESCRQCNAKGTGGNHKTGKVHYGQLQNCLEVTRINGTCYAENEYVKVIDNKESCESGQDGEAASYNCEEATDGVNGAYSPILDALFHGTVVARMFEDWYSSTPLNDRVRIRVHYGKGIANAYWNGGELRLGDGDEKEYPYVNLDTLGHEIGHGVTEQSSKLLYANQWGGINEAFSDMMGETSEAYLSQADWVSGWEIQKGERPPSRILSNPSADGKSISHVDNFTDDLDVHYGSGVYNRVFYLLVHEYEQPIKEIFRVFLHANRMYWHHMSDYNTAACDVMKSAYDLGQDGALFRRAFKEVGIEVCDIETHFVALRDDTPYSDITVFIDATPAFLYIFPTTVGTVTLSRVNVTATSSIADVHIILTKEGWDADEKDREILAEDDNFVQMEVKTDEASFPFYIWLTTQSEVPLTDVTLRVASF